MLTSLRSIILNSRRDQSKWSLKSHFILDLSPLKMVLFISLVVATREEINIWKPATDTMKSSQTWTKRPKWFTHTLTTHFAQSKDTSTLLEHSWTAKCMGSVKFTISKKTSGTKLTAWELQDLVLLSVLSKTTLSLHSGVESTRRILLTPLNAMISPKTSGKRLLLRVKIPSMVRLTNRIGFLGTWVLRTKLPTMKSWFSEEKVPSLNRSSMGASYSMPKQWRSKKRESLWIRAPSWIPH